MYVFNTLGGKFAIVHRAGRWHAMFQDEDLGSYHSAQHALDHLVGGHTFTPSCSDECVSGLPTQITEWELVINPERS